MSLSGDFGTIAVDAMMQAALDSVQDDYESAATIASDLSRQLGRDVSVEETLSALQELANRGDVFAFTFDQSRQQFVRQHGRNFASVSEVWFLGKTKGRV